MHGIIPATEKARGIDKTPPPQMVATKLKTATLTEVFRRRELCAGLSSSRDT